MDWIDDIVENVYRNYKKRKVVLWGKYGTSEQIKDKLKTVHGINTAFYVDKDVSKIDNRQVFSTDCLSGKSDEYYVVVPVAYYQSLKDELAGGGYKKDKDYYYFCDCIVKMTDDYYEDSHGNIIMGSYNHVKFVFSGFNSVVKIGNDVDLRNSSIHVHSNAKVVIGDNCKIENNTWFIREGTNIEIGAGCILKDNTWNVRNTHIEIGDDCFIIDNQWSTMSGSRMKLGNCGSYRRGKIIIREDAQIMIGQDFSINTDCFFSANRYTQIIIGDAVLCSRNIVFRSNDGHSIFDVCTGENINSTEEINRNRKIIIGNHVWIGTHSIILYNTDICDGSIIGAGSLVKGKIPNNCIAAGTPAKVIRKNVAWGFDEGASELTEFEKIYAKLTEDIQ